MTESNLTACIHRTLNNQSSVSLSLPPPNRVRKQQAGKDPEVQGVKSLDWRRNLQQSVEAPGLKPKFI